MVPAAVLLPALSTMAPADPVAVVVFEVVLIGSVRLMSPLSVSTNTLPVAYSPLAAPTVPMVNPPLASVKLKEPIREPDVPPASVPTALLVLVSVKLPAPANARLVAVIAPVWVTAVDAVRLIVELVAVVAALMAMVPPVAVIGPAIVVAVPKVIF